MCEKSVQSQSGDEVQSFAGSCRSDRILYKKPGTDAVPYGRIKPYGQYWFVTITPYGRDIEPNVPDKEIVMEHFKQLSKLVGLDSVGGGMTQFW